MQYMWWDMQVAWVCWYRTTLLQCYLANHSCPSQEEPSKGLFTMQTPCTMDCCQVVKIFFFHNVRLQSCGFCQMLYFCFGDWQGRKLLVIGTSSLVRVLESMSLLDAFNVHLNVPQLKPADMKQVNFYWPQMLQVASADYFCSDRILMYLPIVICNFWTSRIYFSHTSKETSGTFGINITCSQCTRIFEIVCEIILVGAMISFSWWPQKSNCSRIHVLVVLLHNSSDQGKGYLVSNKVCL